MADFIRANEGISFAHAGLSRGVVNGDGHAKIYINYGKGEDAAGVAANENFQSEYAADGSTGNAANERRLGIRLNLTRYQEKK